MRAAVRRRWVSLSGAALGGVLATLAFAIADAAPDQRIAANTRAACYDRCAADYNECRSWNANKTYGKVSIDCPKRRADCNRKCDLGKH
jgi:hypothetical protein